MHHFFLGNHNVLPIGELFIASYYFNSNYSNATLILVMLKLHGNRKVEMDTLIY
jgi:hypothetical protein